MAKGDDTKTIILNAGLELASQLGLEGVTIGNLARITQMSKSGLFAHFRSKENLQLEILTYAGDLFTENVVAPALKVGAGVERLKALIDNWIDWTATLSGGCIFVTASNDFKDRPGNVRDLLLKQQEEWLSCLRRIAGSAIETGAFNKDMDRDQFAFEIYSLLLGFHLYHTLLKSADIMHRQRTAMDKLINSYRMA